MKKNKSLNSWKIENLTEINQSIKTKRLLDIFLSLTGLFVTFPLWIVISFIIYLEDSFPIFFIQNRVGRNGIIFKTIKFRSMSKDAELKTAGLSDKNIPKHFITKSGRLLRNTALDELPQLINIFKGDMSLVGPRTMVGRFYNYLTDSEKKLRLSVLPGLTGLAQIYAREDSKPKIKLRFDLLYIKKRTVFLDIKLILVSIGISLCARWKSSKAKF